MSSEEILQTPPQKSEIPLNDLMPLIRERIAQGQSVRFYPQGISMLPMLRPGTDSVELSAPPAKLKKYDLPLYQRKDGSFVLHRVVKVGQTYCCAGDNLLRVEKGVEQGQMIALVTAFYRGDQRHSVGQLSYRLYCRCWAVYRLLRRVKRKLRRIINRLRKEREL
jgi:hypothetical protein